MEGRGGMDAWSGEGGGLGVVGRVIMAQKSDNTLYLIV